EGFIDNYFFMQKVEEGIVALQDRVLLKGSWQNKRDHFNLRGGVIEESYCHTGVFSEWRISNDGNPTCGRQLYLQKVSLDYAWTFRIYVVRNAPWGEELEEGPLARAWFNELESTRIKVPAEHLIERGSYSLAGVKLIKMPLGSAWLVRLTFSCRRICTARVTNAFS